MNFRVLGSTIEYEQAAKRLEELTNAQPNSPEALEYKELLQAFIQYEKEVRSLQEYSKPEKTL